MVIACWSSHVSRSESRRDLATQASECEQIAGYLATVGFIADAFAEPAVAKVLNEPAMTSRLRRLTPLLGHRSLDLGAHPAFLRLGANRVIATLVTNGLRVFLGPCPATFLGYLLRGLDLGGDWLDHPGR